MELMKDIADRLANQIKPVMVDEDIKNLFQIKSPTTLYKILSDGLPYSVIGGRRYYTFDKVIEYIKSKE